MNAGDTPLPSSLPEDSTNDRRSYEDLRRLNRTEAEKKKFESRDRPSQPGPIESTTQSTQEPDKPRMYACIGSALIRHSSCF